jgi:FKBP-type peptidyl-prolyl cis-trans isomerase 2
MIEKEKTAESKTKKNDFVEIEFVGRANGEIFDTNIKKQAEKINLKIENKPLIVCIGQGMLVKGFDKELEGKDFNKEYKIKISPEDAFGARNKDLIKIIPLSIFKEKNITPAPGLMLNLDGMLAKIITASGGRIITDFNNPLSGKEIEYDFTIKRKIKDEEEKINALQDFFFKKRFSFTIKEKKIMFNAESGPFVKIFSKKFKEILKKDIEVEEKKKETEVKEKKEVSSKKHNKEK